MAHRAPVSARHDVHLPTEITLLVLLSVLWGGSFTLIKIAVETIPPATVVAVRVAFAAAMLIGIARWRGHAIPRDAQSRAALLVQGVLQCALPFTLISWGEVFIPSGLAGVLNATPPLFVFLITRFITRDAPRDWRKTAGVATGLGGVIVITGADAVRGITSVPLAQLAVLGASLSYAVASLWARRFDEQSPSVTAAGAMAGATIIMVPLALVADRPWTLAPSAASIAASISLAVVSTGLAMAIFFRLLGTLGALGTTSGSYLRAGASVLLGMLFLGESFSAAAAGGMALIAAGVALVSRRRPRPGEGCVR